MAPVSTSIFIFPVQVTDPTNIQFFSIPILVTGNGKNTNLKFDINALIDSGADGKFLDKKFALKNNKMALTKLNKPIVPYNVDRTKNKAGAIEYSTWLKIQMEDKQMNI